MSEEIFILVDGDVRLHTHAEFVDEPIGAVMCVHGLSDHSGRYSDACEVLGRHHFNTFRFDLRGYGRSDGLPGYIEHFDDHVRDFAAALEHCAGAMGSLPLFLYAQSMGALITAHYLLRHPNPFNGVIYSSGLFKVNEDLSPLLQKLSGLIAAVAPKLKTVPLDPAQLSRDEQVGKRAMEDPLHYTEGIRARTGAEVLKATAAMQHHVNEITYPLLVLHGEADNITKPESSQLLFEEAVVTDKTLKLYPGARHELFNELCRDEYFRDVLSWLQDRV